MQENPHQEHNNYIQSIREVAETKQTNAKKLITKTA